MFWRNKNKKTIRVKVKVMAFLDGKAVNKEFEWVIKEGSTLKKLFSELDKKKVINRGYFKRAFSFKRPPTLLLNGDRVDLKKDIIRYNLKEGDEIAVLMPIAGGGSI